MSRVSRPGKQEYTYTRLLSSKFPACYVQKCRNTHMYAAAELEVTLEVGMARSKIISFFPIGALTAALAVLPKDDWGEVPKHMAREAMHPLPPKQ